MKICGRCDQSIKVSERYTKHDMPGASHAGTTVYLHVRECQKVPTQSTQSSVHH